MTLRPDRLYDVIAGLKEKTEDVKRRRKAVVKQDAIPLALENIYALLTKLDKIYEKSATKRKEKISDFFANQRNRDFPM